MKYRSDQILIPITESAINGVNSYVDYTIQAEAPYWYNPPKRDTLFTGRAYVYKTGQKIYLNDILSTYADNYSWMSYENVRAHNNNRLYNSIMDVTCKEQRYVFSNITTQIGGYSNTQFISMYYRDKGLPSYPGGYPQGRFWFTQTSYPESFNVLHDRVAPNIIPRIPALDFSKTDFFVGGLFGVNAKWRSLSETDGDGVFRVVILDEDYNIVEAERTIYDYPLFDLTSPVTSILIGGYIVTGWSPDGYSPTDHKGHYLAIAPAIPNQFGDIVPEDVSNSVILAQFDSCNADYYLIWCDRTGGYQCQPFHKKTTMTEDIQTTTITNILDETRPMLRAVSNSWQLNSDWLSYDEYKAYESIFTSPYTYLFDVKHNELTPVVCTEKKWVEKTKSNNNKPFNLKITVTANTTQNILY